MTMENKEEDRFVVADGVKITKSSGEVIVITKDDS